MDLRNASEITLLEAYINVLDVNEGEIILGKKPLDLKNEEIREFVYKHCYKSLTDDKCYLAKLRENSSIRKKLANYKETKDFYFLSSELSKKLFETLKINNLNSNDFLAVKFRIGLDEALGFIKLDFKTTYIHDIDMVDGELSVDIALQKISLPSHTQKAARAVFFEISKIDSGEILVYDKDRNKKTKEKTSFLNQFLEANIVLDYKAKTMEILDIVEDWTRKNLKEDLETALKLREDMLDIYLDRAVISPDETFDDALSHSSEMKISLSGEFEKSGIDTKEKFDLDKHYIDKKLSKRNIITDSGFTIRADIEKLKNEDYFEKQINPDGSMDIIIKNIKSFKES